MHFEKQMCLGGSIGADMSLREICGLFTSRFSDKTKDIGA